MNNLNKIITEIKTIINTQKESKFTKVLEDHFKSEFEKYDNKLLTRSEKEENYIELIETARLLNNKYQSIISVLECVNTELIEEFEYLNKNEKERV